MAHSEKDREDVLIMAASNIFAGLVANIHYSVKPAKPEDDRKMYENIAVKSYQLALVIEAQLKKER